MKCDEAAHLGETLGKKKKKKKKKKLKYGHLDTEIARRHKLSKVELSTYCTKGPTMTLSCDCIDRICCPFRTLL